MRIRAAILAAAVLPVTASSPQASVSGELEVLSDELFQLHGNDPGILVREATDAYLEGDYAGAAEYYIRALLSDLDENPIALYNLACCYGLLGEEELAGNALILAARSGFDMVDLARTDPDLSQVADGEYFNRCIGEMERIIDEDRRLNSEEVLGDRIYLEFPSMQTVRVHLPDDYDPAASYDLVLALHGYSGDVSEFSSRWDAFEVKDFVFASLQAPYAFESNGRTVYSWALFGSSPWDGQDMPPEQMAETYPGSMDLASDMVLACVERLKELYSIDRVFLLGFSQGGIMTYRTAMRRPEAFSGIATFSGILDDETASDEMLESACSLPVFLGRGTQEDDRAIQARDRLLEKGFDVTFHEYEGGHFFPDSSLRAFESWLRDLE